MGEPLIAGLDQSTGADSTALVLFVPPSIYAKGEAWIRQTYRIGADVRIIENRPMPAALSPETDR